MAGGWAARLFNRALFSATTAAALSSRWCSEPVETLASQVFESPELAALPLPAEAAHFAQPRYTTPAGWLREGRGILYHTYANSLFTSRRTLLLDANNTYQEYSPDDLAPFFYWRPRYLRRIEPLTGCAVVLRSAANNYYHTLVDNLPRLWSLNHPALRDRPIRLLVPGRLQNSEAYFLPKLLPANVTVSSVAKEGFYRPESMLVCSFLSRQLSGCLPTAWLDFFRARVLPNRPRRRRNRIYISRSAAQVGRRILNEEELVGRLARWGVQSCQLERLSQEEQIELFYDAQLVIAPHGAGLTNLLFAERVDVIELHPTRYLMPHYVLLSLALGHRHRCLLGVAEKRHTDFRVDVDGLVRMLASFD
jgi:hypothetical protein